MADIFDEINEELKQDRQAVLWQRYGKYVIAVAVLVIAVVGARQGYVYWTEKRDGAAATAYYQAASANDSGEALQDVLDSLTPGYQMLADFTIARKLAEQGKSSEAEAAFLDLAEREDIDGFYRETALLLSVMHAPDSANSDDLLARIAVLTDTAGPLQGLALEQAAGLALKKGRASDAASYLEKITTLSDVPSSLRQRATQLLTIVSDKGAG